MTLLSWLSCLGIFFLLLAKAADFHHKTLCRQEAWLASTELTTRSLLTKNPQLESLSVQGCRITSFGSHWRSQGKTHVFALNLKGKL